MTSPVTGRTFIGIAALVIVISFGLFTYAFVDSHSRAADARRDSRAATVLLARAVCSANAVLEEAVLMDGRERSERELVRIHEFFARFNAPVNEALRTLEAEPCEKGSP